MIYETKEKVRPKSHAEQGNMQKLAEKEVEHYQQPLPEARPPEVSPFPRPVIQGLWAGIGLGALLGLLFGLLLQNNILVIPGWEGLFSMGPFTFLVFWAVMGSALGLVALGIAAILTAPGPQDQP